MLDNNINYAEKCSAAKENKDISPLVKILTELEKRIQILNTSYNILSEKISPILIKTILNTDEENNEKDSIHSPLYEQIQIFTMIRP